MKANAASGDAQARSTTRNNPHSAQTPRPSWRGPCMQWNATATTYKYSLTPTDWPIPMMYVPRYAGIDELKTEIADRLRPVCSHFPDDEFAALIDQIARIEHKYAIRAWPNALRAGGDAESAPLGKSASLPTD